MQFLSQLDQQDILSKAGLPKISSINVLNAPQADGLILDLSLGRSFKNSISRVSFDTASGIIVRSTGEYEDFMQMDGKRKEFERNLGFWKATSKSHEAINSELELSNVGISLAINLEIDGKEYAVLARRRMKDDQQRLMLVSGYIDAAKFFDKTGDVANISGGASVVLNAIKEGSEEALLGQQPGWFQRAEFRGDLLRHVGDEIALNIGNQIERLGDGSLRSGHGYEQLSYNDNWWTMTSSELPAYIENVFTPPRVTVDGSVFDGAGFQVHMHTNSGQIIVGMKYNMDLSNRELLSLLHAEDGPLALTQALKMGLKAADAPPDLLATRLDRRGLILAELDAAGKLTPKFFNFVEGSLVPAEHLGELDNIHLSDAFVAPSSPILKGFVDRENVKATDYFAVS